MPANAGVLLAIAGRVGLVATPLKIVVSPVRVWVSPFLKMPANRRVSGRPASPL